jgi:hypothetical protein
MPFAEEIGPVVLHDVALERERQLEKWGLQHHPDGTGKPWQERGAEVARLACEMAFNTGQGVWADILAEEVAEAFAESDPEKLAEELVQVAAVAVAWVEDIRSRS